jgi:pentatricopeptide repeat protein
MLDMDRAGIKPDAVSYGPLIVALVKQKQMEQADGLLREMEYSGVKPDEFIWNWLVEGYARTDQLEKVWIINFNFRGAP